MDTVLLIKHKPSNIMTMGLNWCFFFLKGIFVCSQSGDHPKEEAIKEKVTNTPTRKL
jgi:hypothetical protein